MSTEVIAPSDAALPDLPPARLRRFSRALTLVPLALILAVQAILTIRLLPYVGADPFDEAIYVYGGHQLIYELLHGGGSPYYETWYSGAPVIYPVIGALADHFGGLMLARELSLIFMICATVLLFLTARRLFGYWVGITAAGLFVGLGVTQDLGALATYDAMALMMLSAAAYCAVRSVNSTRWLLMVPVMVLLANATKYVTLLFDPVIVGLAAFQLIPDGWRRVGQRLLALGSATFVLTGIALFLAGSSYVKGIMFTTLSRKGGASAILGAHFASATTIVSFSWELTGAVIAMGAIALLISFLRRASRQRHSLLLTLLLFAGLIVTLGNVRLHTDESMYKHDDFGIWFTCIPAAYALAYMADAIKRWRVKIPVLIIASAAAGLCGYYYSQPANFSIYFVAKPIVAYEHDSYGFLRPYLNVKNGEYLLGSADASEMVYYNHDGVAWWQFFDDTYLKYPIPGRGGDSHGQAQGLICGDSGQPPATDPNCMYLEGSIGFSTAIHAHWFALVTLDGNHGLGYDKVILDAVESTPGYVLITRHGGAPTFIYAPDYPGFSTQHYP